MIERETFWNDAAIYQWDWTDNDLYLYSMLCLEIFSGMSVSTKSKIQPTLPEVRHGETVATKVHASPGRCFSATF